MLFYLLLSFSVMLAAAAGVVAANRRRRASALSMLSVALCLQSLAETRPGHRHLAVATELWIVALVLLLAAFARGLRERRRREDAH